MLRPLPPFRRRSLRAEALEPRRLLTGVYQFSVSAYTVGENGGDALITVARSGNLAGSSSVQWATSNGTANAGSDYDAASGVVSFGPNQTARTFTVRTRLDAAAEGNETVNLTLTGPTGGASLGTRRTATLTILDASLGFAETRLTDQLNSPVTMAIAPDGRIFVAEQAGKVRVIKNGVLLSAPALTVNTVADDEEGLVGLAVDPNFATNNFLYATYTVTSPVRRNVISRFRLSGDLVVAGSEVRLFELDPNVAHYHIGGAIHFGADGKLYTSTGDNANGNNSSSLSTLHGKLLRLNADGSIPTDNPFYTTATGNNRAIWALGLRNAFTFDVQPGTGRILISEVGGSSWEEVNEGVAGANYGWPAAEGPQASPPAVTFGSYRNPLHSYDHSRGLAITGAAFYNPTTVSFPTGYAGKFFYTEYVNNEIRWIDPDNPASFTSFRATSSPGPVDVRVGPDGALYYLSRGNSDFSGGPNVPGGSVFKISYTGSSAPSISIPPADRTVPAGLAATFSVVASGPGPLSYQWQRNGANVTGATSASYTTPVTSLADDGALYRVVVTNASGSVTSSAARLTVINDQPPVPVIAAPTGGATFRYGDVLQFSGSASDPEDGPLGATALTWRIDYFTGTAQRPALPSTSGISGGSYSISTQSPYKGTDVFYRVWLTATDSQGLSASVFRDVTPVVSRLWLEANVPGLGLTLDGALVASGTSFDSVAGLEREIGAAASQSLAGVTYNFVSWSDGGASRHVISTPTTNTTYAARYRALLGSNTTLVDWGGNYVSDDTAFARYTNTVESGLTLDGSGVANDFRWQIPYSDSAPLNPNPAGGNAYGSTYGQGSSWRFYGGLVFQSYNAPFQTRWAEVWGNTPEGPAQDRIYAHAGSNTATDGAFLAYWKQADFLQGAGGTVQFTSDSTLRVEGYLGADGLASENSGWLRFVVRDGNQFFISQEIAQPAGAAADFVFSDPNSRLWAVYNPQAAGGLKFDFAAAQFAPHFFTNVTALGVYHANDNSTDPQRHAGINFRSFKATGAITVTPTSSPGFYDRNTSTFFLKNSPGQGTSDVVFSFGPVNPQWVPVAADWNGDGSDSVGFFDRTSATWFLKNENSQGLSDVVFGYGPTGTAWTPLVGDWDGNGAAGVGFYNQATATWYLKNAQAPGISDYVFSYGPARTDGAWVPLVGDWNGDGIDTVGFYEKATSTFFLKNSLGQGLSDVIFSFGPTNSGWTPLAGDWNGDGRDSVGFYQQQTATWFLKNGLSQGLSDLVFTYGPARTDGSWIPLVGDWDGAGAQNLRLAAALPAGGARAAAAPFEASAVPVADERLFATVEAALAAWAAWGLDDATLARLTGARWNWADLPGDQLGLARGGQVWLDRDAAGRGWFVDLTPAWDEEFAPGQAIDPRAVDRVDLWTVVAHELGHLAGLDDLAESLAPDVMSETLPVGTRRRPG